MKNCWNTKMIGQFCITRAGGTPLKSNKDYYEGGTIPWLMSGEVNQGEISEASYYITELGLKNSAAKIFPKNTVLVAMYGATAGQVGILRLEAATNQAVCGILPNKEVLPEFLYYCFLNMRESLIRQAVGNAQPNISQEKIRNLVIPVPPLPEQKHIVTILDEVFSTIDKAKENAEKNLNNAREFFSTYLQGTFIKLGEEHEKKVLSSLCDIKHGYAFESKDFEDNYQGKTPIVITPGNFSENGKLSFTEKNTKRCIGDYSRVYLFDKGDLVVVMTDLSSKMKILGRPAFIEMENILHNQRIGRFANIKPSINIRYLYYYLQTTRYLNSIKESATGTMVKHTAPKRILSSTIPLPPMGVQDAIVNKLDVAKDESEKLCLCYQQKLRSLDSFKKSILQKAFKGELTGG